MHRILKIVAAVLGVLGIIFLVRIISAGDEAIKSGEKAGLVDPMAFTAYVILAIVVGFVVFFVVKNLFTTTFFYFSFSELIFKIILSSSLYSI